MQKCLISLAKTYLKLYFILELFLLNPPFSLFLLVFKESIYYPLKYLPHTPFFIFQRHSLSYIFCLSNFILGSASQRAQSNTSGPERSLWMKIDAGYLGMAHCPLVKQMDGVQDYMDGFCFKVGTNRYKFYWCWSEKITTIVVNSCRF